MFYIILRIVKGVTRPNLPFVMRVVGEHTEIFLVNSLLNNKKDVLLHRFCVTAYDGKEPR